MPVIWVSQQEEYFPQRGWTDFWVICPSGKLADKDLARLAPLLVMAGLDPAIHASASPAKKVRRGSPGQAR
jgi:hypothetical protein